MKKKFRRILLIAQSLEVIRLRGDIRDDVILADRA